MSTFKITDISIHISPFLNEQTIPAGTAAPNGKTYKKRRKSYEAIIKNQIRVSGTSDIDLYPNDRVLLGTTEYMVLSFHKDTKSAQIVSLGYTKDQISITTEMPMVLTRREWSESSEAPF